MSIDINTEQAAAVARAMDVNVTEAGGEHDVVMQILDDENVGATGLQIDRALANASVYLDEKFGDYTPYDKIVEAVRTLS